MGKNKGNVKINGKINNKGVNVGVNGHIDHEVNSETTIRGEVNINRNQPFKGKGRTDGDVEINIEIKF